jgi:peptidoglycan/LPS O-acetylase OafA/YrhL
MSIRSLWIFRGVRSDACSADLLPGLSKRRHAPIAGGELNGGGGQPPIRRWDRLHQQHPPPTVIDWTTLDGQTQAFSGEDAMGDAVPPTTVRAVFDPRANGLNLLRLVLASGVIVWHSFPLTGHDIKWQPLAQLAGSICVDGFFAISGFLICGSWLSRPQLGAFLRARALRILPGFYTCLIFTAFILAPGVLWLSGQPGIGLSDSLAYVRANALLRVYAYDIGGTPFEVPFPHAWNGSLWTLWWEALCYLGVALLGLLRLLRVRVVVPGLFGLAWLVSLAATTGLVGNDTIFIGSRLGIMFLAGMLVRLFADRLPVTGWLVAGAAALVAGSALLPNYGLLAALPLAYLLIVVGAWIRSPRLRFRNDISYGVYIYAFPVQQSLALLGLWRLGVPGFAVLSILATAPFAIASWFGVEKPLLRWRGQRPSSSAAKESLPDVLIK